MSDQPHPPAPAAPRILIVDDERRNRQLLEVMLGADGYELETAESGDEALATLAARPFDLVLLDVMMPGTDGYRVVAAIKANAATRDVPVVMVSAIDDRASRTHAANVGASEFLVKPVSREEVTGLVRRLLRDRG